MVPDSRKRRKKNNDKEQLHLEQRTELGAGEQAVTQGLSAGDLLQLEIEQSRTGRRESLVERSRKAGAGPARGSRPTASDGWRRTELADVSTAPQAPPPARAPRYPGRCLHRAAPRFAGTAALPAQKPSPVLPWSFQRRVCQLKETAAHVLRVGRPHRPLTNSSGTC